MNIPYSGKFSREKISRMLEIEHFANNIFANQCYTIALSLSTRNKTFADNIFANSLKFAKIFSRENFPLYGTRGTHGLYCTHVHENVRSREHVYVSSYVIYIIFYCVNLRDDHEFVST